MLWLQLVDQKAVICELGNLFGSMMASYLESTVQSWLVGYVGAKYIRTKGLHEFGCQLQLEPRHG